MYNKEEFKKKTEERTKDLQKNLKELSNQLITDTEKLDKIIDSWKQNLYRYSGYNIFSTNIQLMRRTGRPVSALNSYKRWQEENRSVKKGEKALFVLAPLTYKKEDPEEEDMEELITSFRSVPVFDISQTEGEALNYTKSNNKLISETNIKFKDLIKYSPVPVFLDSIKGGGWTDGKRICINKESNNQNRICSLFHELGHYELHFHSKEGKNKTDSVKELEAEAISYCLSRLIGLENDTSGAYLRAWKGTNKELDKSGLDIIKTADKISRYLLKDIIT